jgi:hypothetical protein
MPNYGPELVTIMRKALDEAITKIPVEQATTAIKVHMAQMILKAAAEGRTTYDDLLAAVSN